MSEVVVIDHGAGNFASVAFALGRLGIAARLTAEPAAIRAASHVILPGVGAAGQAMQRLIERGLTGLIPTLTQPVLGICLGMQLLHEASAEDEAHCLGVLPGRAERLAGGAGLRVPHMGWNTLEQRQASPLTEGIAPRAFFYFVHSYAVPAGDLSVATATHGRTFSALVSQRNFHGVQFHPERSGGSGARLLANFLAL